MNYNISSDVGSGPFLSPSAAVTAHFPAMSKKPSPMLSVDSLTNQEVWNHDDEQLGVVQDFMIDTGGGGITYLILSTGGFLGMGSRLFAVPWSAMTLDTERHRFILDEAAERLKQAPGFDKHDWPDMADSNWAFMIHDFYGSEGRTPLT